MIDGNFVLLVIFWVAQNALIYRIGYTHALKEALKMAKDMHAPAVAEGLDAEYWRRQYEELAEDWGDHELQWKADQAREEYEEDERGEAAE